MKAIILLFLLIGTKLSFASNPLAIAGGVLTVAELVSDFINSEGVQGWLYDQGIYVDNATGEMFWNGANGEGNCAYYVTYSPDQQPYQSVEALCNATKNPGVYGHFFDDYSGSGIRTEGMCRYRAHNAAWAGVNWSYRCPSDDKCKPFDDLASLDDDAYDYDESDEALWNKVLSKMNANQAPSLQDWLKKKKSKKKKPKRRKKYDPDIDQSACGKKFKKSGKKRKVPKDDDEDEDEDPEKPDPDKDKDDKDKDDKDKDDKDKDDKDKDDKDKDDKDKDDKDKDKDDKDKCSICELRKDIRKYEEEKKSYRSEVLKELRELNKKSDEDKFNRKEPDLPKVRDKDYTESKRIEIKGRCPNPYVLDLQIGRIEFKYDMICRYAELIRYFVLASAALMSAYILLGVAKRG